MNRLAATTNYAAARAGFYAIVALAAWGLIHYAGYPGLAAIVMFGSGYLLGGLDAIRHTTKERTP